MFHTEYTMKDHRRFWTKVNVPEDLSECWEWTASKKAGGYGQFVTRNVRKGAHQVAYVLTYCCGHDAEVIMHTCDNPGCCNPMHLRAGTHLDNNLDKLHKGRDNTPYGEDHSAAKLTDAQVIEIRRRYACEKTSHRKLAAEYGIGKTQVGAILRYEKRVRV